MTTRDRPPFRLEPHTEDSSQDLTDLGNARRFIEENGTEVRHCDRLGGWLVYDGTRWRLDETGETMRRLIACAESFRLRCFDLPADERRTALAFARRSLNRGSLDAALAVARSLPGVAVSPGDFDRDHWLLNLENGTLDLHSGELRSHDPEDMIRRLAPVAWSEMGACPRFDAFLRRVLPSPEVREFVQRFAGLTLSGDTSAHGMVFLHGTGRNGKSTLVETLKAILGDYAVPFRTDALMKGRGSDAAVLSELAGLQGVRMTASIETEEGVGLNESMIKGLTGGEELVAKFMHQNTFRFRPEFKMWMSGNHKPTIRGDDDGIWERVMLVPFEVQIPAEERDRDLPGKLLEEAPGILLWALDGLDDFLSDGLRPPAEVRAATDEYRSESDVFGQFLDERTEVGPQHCATAQSLLQAYNAWATSRGFRETNSVTLGRKLGSAAKRRGFHKQRSNGLTLYPKLGLVDSNGARDPFEDD